MKDQEMIELDILKMLHDEWQYRLSQIWSLMTKAITFSFILIFMPFIYRGFQVDPNEYNLPLFIFPITGGFLALIIGVIASLEMRRVIMIKENIKENIRRLSPHFHQSTTQKGWFHNNLPIVICSTQIILAVIITFLVL